MTGGLGGQACKAAMQYSTAGSVVQCSNLTAIKRGKPERTHRILFPDLLTWLPHLCRSSVLYVLAP